MDKGGTAIGTLWYTKAGQRTNLGEDLIAQGLAKVNEFSANMSKHGDALFAAVVEPKKQRLRVWESYDEAAELAAKEAADALEAGLSMTGKFNSWLLAWLAFLLFLVVVPN
jgi:endonuclease YncB( thermonuclease family)